MSPPKPRRMDPKIWRAFAGTAVQIPKLHSRVYYFPQGHVEHTCPSPPHLSPLLCHQPVIPCLVTALDLLADPLTDEAFAKFLLTPLADCRLHDTPSDAGEYDDGDRVVSFTKILTPSDANNGGGFSVPRGCANSIFPALDFQANPPIQVLSITDVHGVVWKFRHIYRGTPRRHLFTTGWSEFVNRKKLVAGDSVVFTKNSDGNIFVGIRRVMEFAAAATAQKKDEVEENRNAKEEGFSGRRRRGKVTAKAVAEAVELVARNMAFEVVYYPGTGGWNFVVEAKVVEEAMKIAWKPGMRVKIAVEAGDSSRMTSFRGAVSSVSAPHNSPWRMLQVIWDDPGVLQNAKQVSPWEVELVFPRPAFHQAFPHTCTVTKKRLCLRAESSEDGAMMVMKDVPPTVSAMISMDKMRQQLLQEGVNEVVISESEDIMRAELFHLQKHIVALKHKQLLLMDHLETENDNSTELNIGSSLSDDLSPHSHTSSNSFRLFGKIIQPVKSDLHDSGCLEDNGRKDVPPTVSAVISTDKLRQQLLQEGVNEVVISESEDIMRAELFHLHKHIVALKHNQLLLMDHLETENGNSTELNIGSSLSDDLSPNSHTSLNSFGTDFSGVHYCNTTKAGCGSIRLFGKIVQPVMSDLHDFGCLGDYGSKASNETEGTDS